LKFRSFKPLLVGLDEAGRGSCVGPLAVSLVALDEAGARALEEAGVRDSKKLTPSARLDLLPVIMVNSAFVAVKMVQPYEIDRHNVSSLTMKAMASLVEAVSRANIKRVVADCVKPVKRLERMLRGRLSGRCDVLVVEDADDRYVECMAASIVAKVARDMEISKLRDKYGVRGSGYPSDPETLSWLVSLASQSSIPPCVRRSWRTLRKFPREAALDLWLQEGRRA